MIFLALSFAFSTAPLEITTNSTPPVEKIQPAIESTNEHPNRSIEKNVLCVEVGWQRIKAALLPTNVKYEELKKISTISAPSAIWLNENFPILFKTTLPNPLTPLLKESFSKISLSISGPVYENGFHPDLGKRGIPEHLKEACEKMAHCDVVVENDVVCWAIGTQEYLKLKSEQLKFPYLALTFGTGIGMALALDENNIYGIEINYTDFPFSRLKHLCSEQQQPLNPRFTPHRALGKPFFDWKLGRRAFTDQEVAPYLAIYNDRFQALIEDLVGDLEKQFDVKIKDILIGGGYSRFIEIPEKFPYSIITLKPQILIAEGISPDIVQLLGCLRLSEKNRPKTYLYPTHPDLVKIRKGRMQSNKE